MRKSEKAEHREENDSGSTATPLPVLDDAYVKVKEKKTLVKTLDVNWIEDRLNVSDK